MTNQPKLYRSFGYPYLVHKIYRLEPAEKNGRCNRCDLIKDSRTCVSFPCNIDGFYVAKRIPPSLPIPDSVEIVEI